MCGRADRRKMAIAVRHESKAIWTESDKPLFDVNFVDIETKWEEMFGEKLDKTKALAVEVDADGNENIYMPNHYCAVIPPAGCDPAPKGVCAIYREHVVAIELACACGQMLQGVDNIDKILKFIYEHTQGEHKTKGWIIPVQVELVQRVSNQPIVMKHGD